MHAEDDGLNHPRGQLCLAVLVTTSSPNQPRQLQPSKLLRLSRRQADECGAPTEPCFTSYTAGPAGAFPSPSSESFQMRSNSSRFTLPSARLATRAPYALRMMGS
jgi:hypothetical protein